jgi:hypothetical protein
VGPPQVLELIDFEIENKNQANIILYVSMLRAVQATGVHPRLGILTGTVGKAFDDLMHAGVLVGVVLFCLAAISYWRFGSTRADFGTLGYTFGTSLEMLLGSLPGGWREGDNTELAIYVVVYVFLIFFLVQVPPRAPGGEWVGGLGEYGGGGGNNALGAVR